MGDPPRRQHQLDRQLNLRRRLIPGADHGDAITRSDEFHAAFAELLQAERKALARPEPEIEQIVQ